jgi:hypothetical protein
MDLWPRISNKSRLVGRYSDSETFIYYHYYVAFYHRVPDVDEGLKPRLHYGSILIRHG